MNDPINHPEHYTNDPSGIECIEITKHRNFCIGNAIKYLWRAGRKDEETAIIDLKKAIWYIECEINRLEKQCYVNTPEEIAAIINCITKEIK